MKKITLLLTMLLLTAGIVFSANPRSSKSRRGATGDSHTRITEIKDDTRNKGTVDTNEVFEIVEERPQFPGGEAAMLNWIATHVQYPAAAKENNIQGRVVVKFVITAKGTITNVQVIRSADPELDAEAVRVVKSMPTFTPGKMNGKPVNVWYTIPISFRLTQEEKAE